MFNNFTNHIIKSLETNRPPYGLTLIPKQNIKVFAKTLGKKA